MRKNLKMHFEAGVFEIRMTTIGRGYTISMLGPFPKLLAFLIPDFGHRWRLITHLTLDLTKSKQHLCQHELAPV